MGGVLMTLDRMADEPSRVAAPIEAPVIEETIALTYEDKRSGIVVVLRLTPDDAFRIGSAILRSVQSLRTLHQGHKP